MRTSAESGAVDHGAADQPRADDVRRAVQAGDAVPHRRAHLNDEFRGACCKCTKTLDLHGKHAMMCGNYENATKRRHDLTTDLLGRWAKKAGFDVILEMYGLFALTDKRKPADVLIYVYRDAETFFFFIFFYFSGGV